MAIITCITQGKRNKEIAYPAGTTEQVIKNYLRKIYDKLGVSDRLELALYCLHNKIIKSDADEAVSRKRSSPADPAVIHLFASALLEGGAEAFRETCLSFQPLRMSRRCS